LVAKVAIFLEGFVDDAFNFGGPRTVGRERRAGRGMENGIEHDGGSVPGEWRDGGGHLIKYTAPGAKVGALVGFLTEGLLWRHVGERAEGDTGAGEFGGRSGHGGVCGVIDAGISECGGHLGEAEVENFRLTALRDKNIGGFDVSVNDAAA